MEKNIWIWLAALLFAILLWLQSVLLSEQEEIASIPLRIDNLPEELILGEKAEPEIDIILRTKGINAIIFHNQKVEYVVNGEQLKYGVNSIHLSLKKIECSERFREYVTGFDSKVKLIEIDRIITERKPVIIEYENNKERQYFQEHPLEKGISDVKLRGASKVLARIEGVKTEPISRDLFSSSEIQVKLVKPSVEVEMLKDKFSIKLIRVVNQIKTIPLVPVNYPVEANYSISPQKITVKVSGKESILKEIKREDIRIELTAEEDSIYGDLKFELPAGLELQEYTPEKIRIIR